MATKRNKKKASSTPIGTDVANSTGKSIDPPKKKAKKQSEMESERVTRSTPNISGKAAPCLYDFVGESPLSDRDSKPTKQKLSGKPKSKSKSEVKKTKTIKSVGVKESTKSKGKPNPKVEESNCTPKQRVSRVKVEIKSSDTKKDSKQGGRRHRTLQPILPLNLDDVSPVVKMVKSNIPARKRRANSKDKLEEKKPSPPKLSRSTRSASSSFVEPEGGVLSDDSAIFVSPRISLRRFSNGKTSTPADNSKENKQQNLLKKALKNASTPNESNSTRSFTGIKMNISKLSPVQREDTPTSDYGSMENTPVSTPTPTTKGGRKKRSNSPAFTLDDSDTEEQFSLNKSIDKSYKKAVHKKKSYDSTKRTPKLDEWAEKVNSELEDIENFELSVEG